MSPPASLYRHTVLAVGCCVLAVLVAGLAMGALPESDGAPTPEIVEDSNTSNYLQPPAGDTVREGSTVTGVGVGIATAADSDALRGHLDRRRFDRRMADAETTEAQIERVRAELDNLSARTDSIRRASRDTRRAYRAGDLTERELFTRMARLSVAADRASQHRAMLRRHFEDVGARSSPVYRDILALQTDVETLNGPVTDRLLQRFAGNLSAKNTHVRVTGGDGYVLSTVAGDRYYREAQVGADWNRDDVDQFATDPDVGSYTRARGRFAELYPWASSNQAGLLNPPGYPTTTSLYKIVWPHHHGRLTTYIDGATTDVFRELQTKHLDAIPWSWRHTNTSGDLRLNVSGTYPTGALEVNVTSADSPAGVESEVRIDGQYVGNTTERGRLWTVQPTGGFTVNATSGADNVTAAVPPQAG